MIRKINASDKDIYLTLADEFYHTNAVSHPIPLTYHENNFAQMIESDVYLIGYIFEVEGEVAGFAQVSRSYSPEAGGKTLWIEDVYVREKYRSHGLGKEFFRQLEEDYGKETARIRLEVEPDNLRAIALYERLGYKNLPYAQMCKDR